MENLSMDSTCVKVHESANGGEKMANKAVGHTRSGLNTKLHAIVDAWEIQWSLFSLLEMTTILFTLSNCWKKLILTGAAYWQIALMAHGRFGNIYQSMAPAM